MVIVKIEETVSICRTTDGCLRWITIAEAESLDWTCSRRVHEGGRFAQIRMQRAWNESVRQPGLEGGGL